MCASIILLVPIGTCRNVKGRYPSKTKTPELKDSYKQGKLKKINENLY